MAFAARDLIIAVVVMTLGFDFLKSESGEKTPVKYDIGKVLQHRKGVNHL